MSTTSTGYERREARAAKDRAAQAAPGDYIRGVQLGRDGAETSPPPATPTTAEEILDARFPRPRELTEANLAGPWIDGETGQEVRHLVVLAARRRRQIIDEAERLQAHSPITPSPPFDIFGPEYEALLWLASRAVQRARGEWLRQNPPPPDPATVELHRAVVLACTELLTVDSDRVARRVWTRWATEHPRVFGRMNLPIHDEAGLERERAQSARWLEGAGLDVPTPGDPVTPPQPAQADETAADGAQP